MFNFQMDVPLTAEILVCHVAKLRLKEPIKRMVLGEWLRLSECRVKLPDHMEFRNSTRSLAIKYRLFLTGEGSERLIDVDSYIMGVFENGTSLEDRVSDTKLMNSRFFSLGPYFNICRSTKNRKSVNFLKYKALTHMYDARFCKVI